MAKLDKKHVRNGYYIFKLETLIKSKNVSINKVMRETETSFNVLKRLMTGNIQKIDVDVLARLCDYFNCPISDIVEYVPNKK